MAEIKALLHRTAPTLWQDLAGGIALVVVLVAGLHLPGLV